MSNDHNTFSRTILVMASLILTLLSTTPVAGQPDLESLKSAALQSGEPTEQFQLLDSFVRKVFNLNVDTFIKFNEQFIGLALDVGEYDAAVAASGRMAFSYNQRKNDKATALRYIEAIKPYEDSLKTTYSRGAIYSSLGGIYFNGDDYEKAIEQYDLALERFGSDDSLFIADMFLFKGQAYSLSGQFLSSLENMEQAYEIYESQGDTIYMTEVLGELADIYSMNGLYEKAIAEYRAIDSLAMRQNFINRLLINAYNSATTYRKMGKPKQQIEHLQKALDIYSSIDMPDFYHKFTTWCAMIRYYADAGETDQSRILLDSVELKKDYYTGSAVTHGSYLEAKIAYLLALEQWTEAEPLLKQYLAFTDTWKNYDMKKQGLEYAAKLYHHLGPPKRAREYLIAYHGMKDSVLQKNSHNQLLYHQTVFETEKKEQALHRQQLAIQAMQSEQASNRRVMLISVTALAFMFGMLYFFLVRRKALWEKNLQEGFVMQLIKQQEHEKKRLSENLHDSLGQSLLLIKNQVILNQDEATQQIVDEAIAEVNSISKSLHPLQLEQLGLTEAIRTNIATMDRSSDIFFSAELENVDSLFSKNKKLNIYRIVQEVLTNVIKHSGAQACRVELKKFREGVLLSIQDNGNGFEFASEYQKIGSLGLKTIRSRVQQLEGALSFDTQKGTGTQVRITIPIPSS